MSLSSYFHLLHLIVFSCIFFLLSPLEICLGDYCLDDQKAFLLQLKDELLMESSFCYVQGGSWKPNMDCCSWEGVTCDKATGYVIGLDLSDCRITHRISSNSSLFNFQKLQLLDLSNSPTYANFSEEFFIPSEFQRLMELTHLNLANSDFSGQIPLEVSYLNRLVFLDLSTFPVNRLKLEKPNLNSLIGNMSSLEELHLNGIYMSTGNGDWSDTLSTVLPNLRVLSLQECSLQGPMNSSLLQLHYLSELSLRSNNLSSELPHFLANLSSLTKIDLSQCGLYGRLPEGICNLPKLQNLDVSLNSLSGNLPECIFKLPNLEILDMSHNPFTGNLPNFPQNSALQVLWLSFIPFSGVLPDSIGNLMFLTDLYLENCGLIGPIPPSIANLTLLVSLDLSFNYFSGQIPFLASSRNHFCNTTGLLSLEYLSLENNTLEGTLDSSLFTLPSLRELRLQNNRLSAPKTDFADVSSPILRLDLSNNMLNGTVPRFISQLTRLQVLKLSSSKLVGTLELEMFSKLQELTHLVLSGNYNLSVDVRCSSPDARCNSSFHNLEILYLHSCNIRKIPDFLKNLEKLKFVDLSDNQINGQIPNWIWQKNLSHVDLSDNFLTSVEMPLPDLTSSKLTFLDLHSNSLGGPLPILSSFATFLDYSNNEFTSFIPVDSLSYLSKVTYFSVSGNKLVGEIPSSICTAKDIQLLDLSYNQFNGTIPTCLGNFSDTLSVLNLKGNGFHGTMPPNYSSSLRTLGLYENWLEGDIPRSLARCKFLQVIDLGNNLLSGMFPFWLDKLPQLQVLVLRSNRFQGPIARPFAEDAFTMLHVIDVSSNSFTGNLPSEYFKSWKAMMKVEKSQGRYVGSSYYVDSVTVVSKGMEMKLVHILDTFMVVDFSDNIFQGEIPDSLGELKSLVVLNLSRNNLNGQIPMSVAKIRQLESLDLSENKLSGQIPWQLSSLTFLSMLKLGRNQLVGRVPSGGQFNTFSIASYEGNLDLCGFPLLKKCFDSDYAAPAGLTPGDKLYLDSAHEIFWGFVFAGYGCGLVIGVVFGHALFWKNHGLFILSFLNQKFKPENDLGKSRQYQGSWM